MPQYTVYGRMDCPYTREALSALQQRKANVKFITVEEMGGPGALKKVIPFGKPLTVPQIFYDKIYVGGCTDLIQIWLPMH